MKTNKQTNKAKQIKCIRCKRQMAFAKKWLMPEEHINWTCSNCGGDYHVSCKHNETTGMFIEVISDSRCDGQYISKFVFNDDKQKWNKEEIQ